MQEFNRRETTKMERMKYEVQMMKQECEFLQGSAEDLNSIVTKERSLFEQEILSKIRLKSVNILRGCTEMDNLLY